MCTIATAKVQRNYNCHNVYFYECLQIKAVWGIEGKAGYELETVLNSTFYYEMHSMNTRRCATSRFNDSSSGAKVNISFERTKSRLNFFF